MKIDKYNFIFNNKKCMLFIIKFGMPVAELYIGNDLFYKGYVNKKENNIKWLSLSDAKIIDICNKYVKYMVFS